MHRQVRFRATGRVFMLQWERNWLRNRSDLPLDFKNLNRFGYSVNKDRIQFGAALSERGIVVQELCISRLANDDLLGPGATFQTAGHVHVTSEHSVIIN